MLAGMHPTIDIHQLNPGSLKFLGPLVVGQAGWRAVLSANNNSPPNNWYDFKDISDHEFGLTHAEVRSRFFALTPEGGESTAKFVLRVEADRKLLKMDGVATMFAFMPRFDASFT